MHLRSDVEITDTRIKRAGTLIGVGVIVVAASAAYFNCFSAPFVFDAGSAIIRNPTIRHLWPICSALTPPLGGLPVSGRPLVNLSLAVNYAIGGLDVRGYHALNLIFHILAGLTVFGIVRRTVARANIAEKCRAPGRTSDSRASLIAIGAAVLWTVHPLQTESVTYVAQRAECLMGLFYLLTLYCFIRGVDASDSSGWFLISVAACTAGMATKEVMATAPLIVLLYDRTFVAGSFRAAWQGRRRWYLLLACTWLLLAYFISNNASRGGTVGFRTNVRCWEYAISQLGAQVRYLRLSILPHPLVFDYGLHVGDSPMALVVYGLILGALVAATLVTLWHRSPLGFLGAWFFVILIPSSSVVPIATEIIAEHRMYLPLAAVATIVAMGLYEMLGRKSAAVYGAMAVALIFVTVRRNQDYHSEETIWRDTVEKMPNNAGAHNNLGTALLEAGQVPAAILEFNEALRLKPLLPGAQNNLGVALMRERRTDEAIATLEEAVRIDHCYAEAHDNLGRALLQAGRLSEAIAEFREVLPLRPGDAEVHDDLAFALERAGMEAEAVAEYAEALRLDPDLASAHFNLGNVLAGKGRLPEAIGHYEKALQSDPEWPEAQINLGGALLQAGRPLDAIGREEKALHLRPDSLEAQVDLGNALLQVGRPLEAIAHFEAALRLRPDYAPAHHNLGVALRSVGRLDEARVQFGLAQRSRDGR